MSQFGFTDKTEIALVDGDAIIEIVGTGKDMELRIDGEEEGLYPTYTAALERAIFIVNKVG